MKLSELLEPGQTLSCLPSLDFDIPVQSLSADSRAPGEVFFAIRGTKTDGHTLIPEAISNGAKIIIGEAPPTEYQAVQVQSSRRAFAFALSRWYGRPSSKFQLVGITGTNGKTTTAHILGQALNRMGFDTGVIGTTGGYVRGKKIPSELTTPGPIELQKLFVTMTEAKLKNVVMEVTSIAIDQYRTWGSEFQVAAFTNLTLDHLDYHKTFEEYYQTKKRLFTDYHPRFGVINKDDPYGQRLLAEIKGLDFISFGIDSHADFLGTEIQFSQSGLSFKVKADGKVFPISSPLIGRHNVYNILGVLGVVKGLGLDLNEVALALKDCSGAPGRLERVDTGPGGPAAFVDYAHTPDALLNVLRVLGEVRSKVGGCVITVVGCGGDRDRSKRPQMGKIATDLSDLTILTSDNPRTESPESIIDEMEPGAKSGKGPFSRVADRRVAIQSALSKAKQGDFVLIAGKGHEDYQIIGTEKFPFDDRQVIRDYYKI